jgi:histidinol-phosphate aminotransferase
MKNLNLKTTIRKDIAEMKPYVAVPFLWDINQKLERPIKLDSGENQFGCSPKVIGALAAAGLFNFYPDSEYKQLRAVFAKYTGISIDNIMVGSGSDELLDLLFRLILDQDDQVINCPPTFGMYEVLVKLNKGKIISVPRLANFSLDMTGIKKALNEKVKMIVVCTPNNPTGTTTSKDEILTLLRTNKIVIIDEAYFEFSGSTVVPLITKYPNLIVLRTLSKWAGLAGLRLGYGIMNPFFVEQLLKIKPPYNVNSAAVIAGIAAMSDDEWKKRVTKTIVMERKRIKCELQKFPRFEVYPSKANLLFIKVKSNYEELKKALLNESIIVRYYDSYKAFRLSVGTQTQNTKVIEVCKKISVSQQESIIFDMDGVLIDVTESYRQAIVLTANYLLGKETIKASDVDEIKAIPGFNNDWDVTYVLYALAKQNRLKRDWSKIAKAMLPVDRKSQEFLQIFSVFQTYYLGSKMFIDTYKETPPFNYSNSLIAKEKCLIKPNFLKQLIKMGYKIAIATGRPKTEALEAIRLARLTSYFSANNLVALEDVTLEKPSPEPLLLAQKIINAQKSIYVGDTQNDKIAAKAANMDFYFISTIRDGDSFPNVNSFLQWFINKRRL